MEQVVIHLVTNAAQAMHRTGGMVDAQVAAFSPNAEADVPAVVKNRSYLKLIVSDTGPGMAVRKLLGPST